MIPNYLDNFIRLGLIVIPNDYELIAEGTYEALEKNPKVIKMRTDIDSQDGRKSKIIRTSIKVTRFGRQFITACVQDHRSI